MCLSSHLQVASSRRLAIENPLDPPPPPVAASSSLAVAYSIILLVPVQDLHQCRRDANDAVGKPLLAAEISFMNRTLARPLRRSSILPKMTLVRLSPGLCPSSDLR